MRDIYTNFDNFRKIKNVKSELIVEGDVDNPELTIFIPTYKRADLLKETVSSAINQIGNINYEIIIVNNDPESIKGGEIEKTVRSFNCKRIYYYVNEKNIGLCGNWNRGIELSRAKYISMIHDDDILSPWFTVTVAEAIEKRKGIDILGVSFVSFGRENKPQFQEPRKLTFRDVSKKSFFFGHYINIAGITVRKEAILSIGGYNDEYYPNEDTILIYQALLKGTVANLNVVLAGYRQAANLSLEKETMNQIICLTEDTRRQIAKHERFAKIWMQLFDREYLYLYIKGANNYWKTDIRYIDVFNELGMATKPIKPLKYIFMRGLLAIESRRYGR